MAKTLLDLAKSLERRSDRIEKEANKLSIRVAKTIVEDLTISTPVDTSKALSNWQIGLRDAPKAPDDALEAFYPGKRGSTKRSSAIATIRAAKRVLAGKKPGEVIYISNVLPYIRRLNYGHSQQAPAGFVERSVLIGKNEFKKAKFKV